MLNAVVPLGKEKPNTYGWLQFEKRGLKELQTLATRSPAAMGTLMYMLNNMSRSNALVVSQKAIAAELGLSLKSIGNSIKLLTEHHFIQAIKVGNTSVYVVNSKVAWQGERGARYAAFGADVVAIESEQGFDLDDLEPLKSVPKLHQGERLMVGNEAIDPPDQGELDLP
jgi:DNA-binding transcriptional MocR family regulator